MSEPEPLGWQDWVSHVGVGASVGFLAMAIPYSLKNRQLSMGPGLALGVLSGLFRGMHLSVDATERYLLQQGMPEAADLVRRWGPRLGAFGAVLVASSLEPSVHNSVFVLWIAVRALRRYLPDVPGGAVLVMCLSALRILPTWFYHNEQLDPTYGLFMNKFGGLNSKVIHVASYPSHCSLTHRAGEGCKRFLFRYWREGLIRALRMYVPLQAVLFAFSKRKSVPHALASLTRSSVFLSTYCTMSWVVVCLFENLFQCGTSYWWTAQSWVAGTACLIERPGRRNELAAYCFTHAVNSLWLLAKQKHGFQPNRLVSYLLLATSVASLTSDTKTLPWVLKWMLGLTKK